MLPIIIYVECNKLTNWYKAPLSGGTGRGCKALECRVGFVDSSRTILSIIILNFK